MEFAGFSFHFPNKADSTRASASVARLEKGRAGKGIDPDTFLRLEDGFYIWVGRRGYLLWSQVLD